MKKYVKLLYMLVECTTLYKNMDDFEQQMLQFFEKKFSKH